jgi:hypothetical protein
MLDSCLHLNQKGKLKKRIKPLAQMELIQAGDTSPLIIIIIIYAI